MSNNYFQFKAFRINQERCAMKVGTDGVLLGAWCDADGASSVLDIGTGTGLLALMLAQRNQLASITAIEIDAEAANQAIENVEASAWSNRITVVNQSLQEYYPSIKFDLIVSNPPYFSHSLKNPDLQRTTARHTDSLSHDDLLEGVCRLMAEGGRFCVILPTQEGEQFIRQATTRGLFCIRRTEVIPTSGSAVKRLLLTFVRGGEGHKAQTDQLLIEEGGRHVYSEQYKQLTKDFYLFSDTNKP